jgi:iron complex transport system permease protein
MRFGGLTPYRSLGSRKAFWLYRPAVLIGLVAGIALTLFSAIAFLWLGTYRIDAADLAGWLLRWNDEGDTRDFILGTLRLPRILMALLAGVMLGMAGAAMQSATRNGLADPGLIGVKEGAVVTVLAIMLVAPEISPVWRPLAGLAGGAGVSLLVILLARSVSGLRFLLVGIGVSWLLSSAIALFMTMARIEEVQTAMIWLGGSLHAASWTDIGLISPWAIAGLLLLLATARSAEASALGPVAAIGLGMQPGRLQGLLLLASVMLTAACASVVGGLGFVGLVAPHAARILFGARQMPLVIGSGVIGAATVLLADTIGRTVAAPVQIPAGVVLALLGVPFFLIILWQRRHEI